MIDRRLVKNFDWGLFFMILLLSLIGVLTIYSATRPVFDSIQQTYYIRQLYWLAISLFAFFVVVSIDYRMLIRFAYVFFVFGIVLLIMVLIVGSEGMGAQRWINLGFLSFQPSEFFKVFFIIAMSRYLSMIKESVRLGLGKIFVISAVFLFVPAMMILRQPDLGTALILFFIFVAMVLTAGVEKKVVIMVVVISLILLPVGGKFLWSGLKEYQKQRIITFIDPQADPQGVGYHVQQSKVSIGSGGFLGKGYMKGTQGPYRFLPENHTDFIFSIFAEEWGFVGSIVLFFIYLFIIWRGFDTAKKACDREGSYLVLGVTYMFAFYFFVNVGMTIGVVPVVGAPLPLMSYGGTALLSNFLALSIIENVRMRRFSLYY